MHYKAYKVDFVLQRMFILIFHARIVNLPLTTCVLFWHVFYGSILFIPIKFQTFYLFFRFIQIVLVAWPCLCVCVECLQQAWIKKKYFLIKQNKLISNPHLRKIIAIYKSFVETCFITYAKTIVVEAIFFCTYTYNGNFVELTYKTNSSMYASHFWQKIRGYTRPLAAKTMNERKSRFQSMRSKAVKNK